MFLLASKTLIAVFVCVTFQPTSAFSREKNNSAQEQKTAVELLISRLLPGREKEFDIIINAQIGSSGQHDSLDAFELQTTKDNILQITATTGVAAAWGLNHYLKYYCKAHVSWSGRQLNAPHPLPKVTNSTKIISPNRWEAVFPQSAFMAYKHIDVGMVSLI